MAEETAVDATAAADDMDLVEEKEANGAKRAREGGEDENEIDDASKKQKVDKSAEEERLESVQEEREEEGEESARAELGPKSFMSSVEMFEYFYEFLHYWPPNLNVNKYEHLALLDLLKKGHSEPERKIGSGIQAFQVRFHPVYKSRCFFVIRDDNSVDDFSFRKCVDNILTLPEDMKVKPDANKSLGGKGHGGRGGGGKGGRGYFRGRGGKSRNRSIILDFS